MFQHILLFITFLKYLLSKSLVSNPCSNSSPQCFNKCIILSNNTSLSNSISCNSTLYNKDCLITCNNENQLLLTNPSNENCDNCVDELCFGSRCTKGCKDGYWGDDNLCNNSCGVGCDLDILTCNETTGECYFCMDEFWGFECDDTCHANCYGGCNQTTGHCKGCKMGFWNITCESKCNEGCSVSYSSNCNITTGECNSCRAGYWGPSCENKCSSHCYSSYGAASCDKATGKCTRCNYGYWGDDCTNECGKGCSYTTYSGGCEQTSGNCTGTCKEGYWDQYCNSTCPTGCKSKSCDKLSGNCTECQMGKTGSDCSKDCPPKCKVSYYKNCYINETCSLCDSGFWGTTCETECPTGCKSTDCNLFTGACTECNAGFWGDTCSEACSENCNTTIKSCNMKDGSCDCKRGFYGTKCEEECSYCNTTIEGCTTYGYCKACNSGYYGSKCDRKCSENCNTTVANCDFNSGSCNECNRGFYGSSCTLECSKSCDLTTRGCDKSSGRCEECKVGYYGNDCSKECPAECPTKCDRTTGECPDCPDGKWGSKCENDCGEGCDYTGLDSQTCNAKTGECKCKMGYYGTSCDQKCGRGCNTTESNCMKSSGSCSYCMLGWFGPTCDYECGERCNTTVKNCDKYYGKCDNCAGGYWGNNCTDTCPERCKEKCDKTTGYCDNCPKGFYGKDCDTPCSENCDTETENCGVVDGKCAKCKAGYYGTNCNLKCPTGCKNNICTRDYGTCEECEEGFYGSNCNNNCSSGCKGKSCDKTTGACLECEQGYYGTKCSDSCKNCFFANDTDNCDTKGQCEKCKNGFYDGYYSSASCTSTCSTNCDETGCDKKSGNCNKCPNGKYGLKCDSTCSYCREGTACNQTNGDCKLCPKGKYGYRCDKTCPEICGLRGCKIESGECAECDKGFWGEACDKDCTACGELGCDSKGDCYAFTCNSGKYGEKCDKECGCGSTINNLYLYLSNSTNETNGTVVSEHKCSKYSGNCLDCGFGVYGKGGCDKSCHYSCHTMTCCLLNDKDATKLRFKLGLNEHGLFALKYNNENKLIKVDFNKGYPLTLFNTSGDLVIKGDNVVDTLILSDVQYNFTEYIVIGDLHNISYSLYETTNQYNDTEGEEKRITGPVLIASSVLPAHTDTSRNGVSVSDNLSNIKGIVGIGVMSSFASTFLNNNATTNNLVAYKYEVTSTKNSKNKQPTLHINYGSSFKSSYNNFIYCNIPLETSSDIHSASLGCYSEGIKLSDNNKGYFINQTINFSLTDNSDIYLNENILQLFKEVYLQHTSCHPQQKPNQTNITIYCEPNANVAQLSSVGFIFKKFVLYFDASKLFKASTTEYGEKKEFIIHFTSNQTEERVLIGKDLLQDTELLVNNEEGELYIHSNPVNYYYGKLYNEFQPETGFAKLTGHSKAVIIIISIFVFDVVICVCYFIYKRKVVRGSKYVKVN